MIGDAAPFAVMPRAHWWCCPRAGVFADGVALCPAGNRAVAVAAKAHRVPVIVLAGTHQISPLGPDDWGATVARRARVAGGRLRVVAALSSDDGDGAFTVANPVHDRVAPELITLFATDAGGQVPGFIASLMGEFYSPEDRRFDE